jgi:hypothetical protein
MKYFPQKNEENKEKKVGYFTLMKSAMKKPDTVFDMTIHDI